MDWVSYNCFYHGDQELALRKFVLPCVASLHSKGYIDRFYFVRYALGGPHLRLRLRLTSSADHYDVHGSLHTAAHFFFSSYPSKSVSSHLIERDNKVILQCDPHENDASVYPNHSFFEVPFRPEVERYGGADLLAHSLDYFSVSSICALSLICADYSYGHATQLGLMFKTLARQAFHLAQSSEMFLELLGYGERAWGGHMAPILNHVDAIYEKSPARFIKVINDAAQPGSTFRDVLIADSSYALAKKISCSASSTQIKVSHLHMTANRLGLSNIEELYWSRTLTRAAKSMTKLPALFSVFSTDRGQVTSCALSLSEVADSAVSRYLGNSGSGSLEPGE